MFGPRMRSAVQSWRGPGLQRHGGGWSLDASRFRGSPPPFTNRMSLVSPSWFIFPRRTVTSTRRGRRGVRSAPADRRGSPPPRRLRRRHPTHRGAADLVPAPTVDVSMGLGGKLSGGRGARRDGRAAGRVGVLPIGPQSASSHSSTDASVRHGAGPVAARVVGRAFARASRFMSRSTVAYRLAALYCADHAKRPQSSIPVPGLVLVRAPPGHPGRRQRAGLRGGRPCGP